METDGSPCFVIFIFSWSVDLVFFSLNLSLLVGHSGAQQEGGLTFKTLNRVRLMISLVLTRLIEKNS